MASTPTTLQNKTYGIGLKDKVGYALGDAAGLMTFALVGSFLQLFYTNVLYIDPKKRTESSARICAGSQLRLPFSACLCL